MKKIAFGLNDTLSFGNYKGYQVGIIYLIDCSYIEWLILRTDFILVDIAELAHIKLIQRRLR